MSAGTPSFHTQEPSRASRFHQPRTGPAWGSGSESRKAAVQRGSGRWPGRPWPSGPTRASAGRVCSWKLSPMPSKNTWKPRPVARSRTRAEVAPVIRSRARRSSNSGRVPESWLAMAMSSALRVASPRTAARRRWSPGMVAAARAWRRMVHQQMVAVSAVSPRRAAGGGGAGPPQQGAVVVESGQGAGELVGDGDEFGAEGGVAAGRGADAVVAEHGGGGQGVAADGRPADGGGGGGVAEAGRDALLGFGGDLVGVGRGAGAGGVPGVQEDGGALAHGAQQAHDGGAGVAGHGSAFDQCAGDDAQVGGDAGAGVCALQQGAQGLQRQFPFFGGDLVGPAVDAVHGV